MPEIVTLPPETVRAMGAFERNMEWGIEHWEEVLAHRGRYVAVLDERIVAAADDARPLRDRYGDREGLYVAYVPREGVARVM